MKKMIRSIALLLVLVLSLTGIPLSTVAADNETMAKNGDLVLVLDDTGSMTWNDPTRAAKEAVKVFGALLPSGDSNVGVVTFSDRIGASFDMAPVNDQTLKNLETFADTKITRGGQWTDIVVGLTKAVEMLLALPENDNTKAIVVVTDGENEFGGGLRTKNMSDTELKLVKELAYQAGIKIFLIGLNTDQNKVSEYMNGIADATGGGVVFIDDANQIRDTINQFYLELGLVEKSDAIDLEVGRNGVDHELVIPPNTFEAVITLVHTSPLIVTVQDPAGNTLPESDSYTLLRSDTTTVIKLREPNEGTYILHIENETVDSQNVHLDTFLNSEVLVKVNAPATVELGQELSIDASLMRSNQQYENEDLKNLTATAVLTNGTDSVSVDLILESNRFIGSVRLPDAGKWDITVTVRSDKRFIRTNDLPVSVEVTSPVPAATTPQPTPTKPVPSEPAIPIWLIIVIVAVVLILAVAGILVYKYFERIPKAEQVPNRTIVVACKTEVAMLWQIQLSTKRMFNTLASRRDGRTLKSCIDDYCSKVNTPPSISKDCAELFGQISIKLYPINKRGAQKGAKRYDLRFVRQSNNGTHTSTLPISYLLSSGIRIDIFQKP